MALPTAIAVTGLSKKYCRSLKRSMLYGMQDISRNILGLGSRPGRLRPGEFWALDNASFNVQRGETLGIIGPNGSGKTTLLKILNGIFWPDKGLVRIQGKIGALIEVGAGFHPLLTGRENIYVNAAILGMTKKEVKGQFNAIVTFADIGDFLDAPVKHYSSGMYVRLGFAVAAHCRPDILLVDEVLAVGDEGFQRKCFDKIGELKKNGCTTIIISHNMHTISSFSDHVLLLDKGQAEYFHSPQDGIHGYNHLFIQQSNTEIDKNCSGNDSIQFVHVETSARKLNPGDSFTFRLSYEAQRSFPDIEIDTAISNGSDSRLYFQATNRAFGRRIDINQGTGILEITFKDIPLCQSWSKIILAIWSQKRTELLFWWRVPVEFRGQAHASGRNLLDIDYRQEK
ncbi:MAG: ABC transporter ATP-binding protein [Chrysiogenia bacterium]